MSSRDSAGEQEALPYVRRESDLQQDADRAESEDGEADSGRDGEPPRFRRIERKEGCRCEHDRGDQRSTGGMDTPLRAELPTQAPHQGRDLGGVEGAGPQFTIVAEPGVEALMVHPRSPRVRRYFKRRFRSGPSYCGPAHPTHDRRSVS